MTDTPPLLDHQREALPRLQQGHAFLAFEPGLGKTRTCIAALDADNIKGSILVICPAIARENWRNEFTKWQTVQREIFVGKPPHGMNADVTVYSYDAISGMYPEVRNALLTKKWHTLILDEAHRLKEASAKRTKHVYGVHASLTKSLAGAASRVWCLSGTPAPNHLGELWTHLRALKPEAITSETGLILNRVQFEDTYCNVRTTSFGRQIAGSKNVPHLRAKMGDFFMPKKEQDCINLPPLRWETYALPTDKIKDKDVLARIDSELRPYAEADDPIEALRGAGAHIATERRLLGRLKIPLVIEYVEEQLQNSPPGTKLLVFGQHTDVIFQITQGLLHYGAVHIDGAVPDHERNARIRAFQGDEKCRVLVGQLQAAGEAITLTAATRVIFAEASWVPKDNFQAVKRAHRIGQGKSVRATYLVLAKSMDQQIIKSVERKTRELTPIMA
jgi:SNF2 family DNA or RNA helicase